MDEVARRPIPREGFGDLLLDPGRGWMGRYAEMDDVPPLAVQHDEHEQDPEREGGESEEIHGRQAMHVVSQERPPGL